MLIGIVGKPNAGKSTFFAAATLAPAKIAPYPFTTIKPNRGVAYIRIKCVCKEFGVVDNPRNSKCINGVRYVPIELLDVAGLVPGAWQGRGLGNKFLDDLRQADALIHVVDVSGSTDFEGKIVEPGSHDPLEDVKFLENEIDMWFSQILKRDWDKIVRVVDVGKSGDIIDILTQRLSGLSIERKHIVAAMRTLELNSKPSSWNEDDILKFASTLRKISKPIIIVANKMDLPKAEDNYNRLIEEFKNYIIVPCFSEGELALKRAAEKELVRYLPGEPKFEIVNDKLLTEKQKSALKFIQEYLNKWGSTGIQEALNRTVFNALKAISVFPVEDPNRLTDHSGRVLPDVFLVHESTTAREFAYKIHSELGDTFIHAIDVRTKQKLGENHILKDRDVVKIVAAKGIKS
ncbi:MAG: redox-regulated ATPase YchF [Candidatus Methanomethylicia archaeon]